MKRPLHFRLYSEQKQKLTSLATTAIVKENAMLLNWVVLFDHLIRQARGQRRDAFADPLERPEWQGHARINRILVYLVGRF